MKKRDYRDYLQDIINSIDEIGYFTKRMSLKNFMDDKKTINATIRSLEVLGEAAKSIPQTLRKKYPDIPWKKMAGMRDKLIHEYFGVDLEMVWQAVKRELPLIKPYIKKILKDLGE